LELEVDLAEVDGEEEQQRTETEKKQEQKKMILSAKTVITSYCKGCKFGYQDRPERTGPCFLSGSLVLLCLLPMVA
jgi:hypothetical protein